MKTCRICSQEKDESEFVRRDKNTLRNECKDCIKIIRKEYYQSNKSKILKKVKQYTDSHKIEKKLYMTSHQNYYKLKSKKWKEKNPNYFKEWQQNNKDKTKQHAKTYYQKETSKEKIRARDKRRYQNDENYRLRKILRSRHKKALKSQNAKKFKSVMKLIGCTLEEWKNYLLNSFKINYGISDNIDIFDGSKYHIDHVIPLSSFDLTDPEQQKIAFHYTNTQILTSFDNILKGSN